MMVKSKREHSPGQPQPMEHGSDKKKEAVKGTFFSGVMILTLSTTLVKVIGLLYKIPMLHCLGSVGMGYFNAAYEWYALLCVLATAGLPIASSIMIAEARSKKDAIEAHLAVKQIEQVAMRVFLILGAIGSVALFLGASAIAGMIGSPQTAPAIMAVAPTMFFSCLSAAYRGYFQGFQNMRPTAISQLIEALGKLLIGIAFALWASRRGMSAPYVAAFAMLGLSIGVALASLYLILCRKRHSPSYTGEAADAASSVPPIRTGHSALRKRLLSIAVPVTLSAAVLSLTRLVDMTMILRQLQRLGMGSEGANSLYGIYTTMAVPIFNLIPALLSSVALALIPALSSDIERKNVEGQIGTVTCAMRLTSLLAIPASMALALYSHPILALLFRTEQADVERAAPMLSILAISVFFSSMITTTNAILQAYGHVRIPIYSMLIGSAVKLIFAAALIGIPSLNILGAPISTFLCNAVIVGINLYTIVKRTHTVRSLHDVLFRPLLISLPAVTIPGILFSLLLYSGLNDILLFLFVVPLTLLLMVFFSVLFHGIDVDELSGLAGGNLCQLKNKFKRRSKVTKR